MSPRMPLESRLAPPFHRGRRILLAGPNRGRVFPSNENEVFATQFDNHVYREAKLMNRQKGLLKGSLGIFYKQCTKK